MGIRETLRKWAVYQQTLRELMAIPEKDLKGLGITRADLTKIARHRALSERSSK